MRAGKKIKKNKCREREENTVKSKGKVCENVHVYSVLYNAWHILNFQYVLQGKAAQSQSLALQPTDCVNLYQ